MVFDPSDPFIDESKYEIKYWTYSEFGHIKVKEEIHLNMLEPQRQIFLTI